MLETVGLAVALAMDAFAVSCSVGVMLGKPSKRQSFRLSWHFGLFQFLMPLIGWLVGNSISAYLSDLGRFIAFAALLVLGTKMLWDGYHGDGEGFASDPTRGLALIGLSVAVSIDALVVGFSLNCLGGELLMPAIIIGVVATAFSLLGLWLGRGMADKLEKSAYYLGGAILIAIGIKSLF
jgi:putative Mn2+ efflux pump MntP